MTGAPSRLAVVGRTLDALLGALVLDAPNNETISHYVARRSRQDGAGWARVADWYLDRTIERDHCGRVLRGLPTSRGGIVRAALQIGAVILAFCWAIGRGVDAAVAFALNVL